MLIQVMGNHLGQLLFDVNKGKMFSHPCGDQWLNTNIHKRRELVKRMHMEICVGHYDALQGPTESLAQSNEDVWPPKAMSFYPLGDRPTKSY